MITNVLRKSALVTVMRTGAWLHNLMALFVCAALFAVGVPQVAADEPTAAPFLFIDSVLPHPGPANADLLGPLPPGPEERAAALWNWDGLSPVSVQAVFQTPNASVERLKHVEVWVNDQPIPEVWVVALEGDDPEGLVSPDGWFDFDDPGLEEIEEAALFKVRFIVPYEIEDVDLKSHLTLRIKATFKDPDITLEAIKHVTLLNNPNLEDLFANIQDQLDQLCSNDLVFVAIATTLQTAISALSAGTTTLVTDLNTGLESVRSSINTNVVDETNSAVAAVVGAANTAIGEVNSIFTAVNTFDLSFNLPNPCINLPLGIGQVCIPIPGFTINNVLGGIVPAAPIPTVADPPTVPDIPSVVIPTPPAVGAAIDANLALIQCP